MNTELMTSMKRPRRMIFHHAAYEFRRFPLIDISAPAPDRIKAAIEIFKTVDGWHLDRWSTGCGYHYVIGNGHGVPDGYVNIWRPECYRGAHCKGQNHDSIGIMLMGDLEREQPTDKQISACSKLAKRLCIIHGLNPMGEYNKTRYGKVNKGFVISGHRDWRGHESNSCPGLLHEHLPGIRIETEERLILAAPISTVYYKGEITKKERK